MAFAFGKVLVALLRGFGILSAFPVDRILPFQMAIVTETEHNI